MDPTMGRIVYYTPSDPNDVSAVEAPAIVSRVNPDGTLDLTVFPPGASPYSVDNVDQSGSGSSENGKWCWPQAAPSGSAPEPVASEEESPATGEGEPEAPADPEGTQDDPETAADTPAGDGDQGGPEEPQAPAEDAPEGEAPTTSAASEKALYDIEGELIPAGMEPSGLETPDGDTLYHYADDEPGQPGVFPHAEVDGGSAYVQLYADASDNEKPVCPAQAATA